MKLTVIDREMIAQDTLRIRLGDSAGNFLPAFQPGAHVALEFAGYQRRYTLTSDPQDLSAYEICVLCRPSSRGGSAYLHGQLKVGQDVDLLGLQNDFALALSASRSVLIAGGIGVTPFITMADALLRLRKSVELHITAIHPSRFLPLPESLLPRSTFYTGRTGSRPLNVRALLEGLESDTHVSVCGPDSLIQAVRAESRSLGLAPESVHFEVFGSQPATGDQALVVRLERSNVVLQVRPGTTILDAVLNAGIWVGYECRRGICGSCLTPVTLGTPVHRDALSNAQRAGSMCTCVSWAEGTELSLDI